jgi:hypothetical protein
MIGRDTNGINGNSHGRKNARRSGPGRKNTGLRNKSALLSSFPHTGRLMACRLSFMAWHGF